MSEVGAKDQQIHNCPEGLEWGKNLEFIMHECSAPFGFESVFVDKSLKGSCEHLVSETIGSVPGNNTDGHLLSHPQVMGFPSHELMESDQTPRLALDDSLIRSSEGLLMEVQIEGEVEADFGRGSNEGLERKSSHEESYGNTGFVKPDLTSTNYDDIVVSSVQRGTVMAEGFESGLALTTDLNNTTAWYSGGEPTDLDIAGQVGALEWRKSLVYGFGQLLSEDQLQTGTIYEQSDQVGSPNLITDASGVLKNRSKNLPFGERLLLPTANTPKSTRRFTNHEDQDGSAIYMQARTYLPA